MAKRLKPATVAKLVAVASASGVPVSDDEVDGYLTHAGRHQLAAAAWKWFVLFRGGYSSFGSQWTVAEILTAPRVSASADRSDWSLYPERASTVPATEPAEGGTTDG